MRARKQEAPAAAPRLLRRWEASQYLLDVWGLKRSPGSLSQDAVYGVGPETCYLHNVPYYTPEALDRWMQERLNQRSARRRLIRPVRRRYRHRREADLPASQERA